MLCFSASAASWMHAPGSPETKATECPDKYTPIQGHLTGQWGRTSRLLSMLGTGYLENRCSHGASVLLPAGLQGHKGNRYVQRRAVKRWPQQQQPCRGCLGIRHRAVAHLAANSHSSLLACCTCCNEDAPALCRLLRSPTRQRRLQQGAAAAAQTTEQAASDGSSIRSARRAEMPGTAFYTARPEVNFSATCIFAPIQASRRLASPCGEAEPHQCGLAG